jgi:hypothetical protein
MMKAKEIQLKIKRSRIIQSPPTTAKLTRKLVISIGSPLTMLFSLGFSHKQIKP